ncbi:hypothetical protein DL765_000555 [Monosporascus sp. GIB2]|nr:hypothetical protein DL765_000555 [Monosporascus sp. GIB2]
MGHSLPGYTEAGCIERSRLALSNHMGMDKHSDLNHIPPPQHRGVKGSSVRDGNHMLDGGAERPVLEWMASMDRLIAQRDGVQREPLDPAFSDLLHNKAGRPEGTPQPEPHAERVADCYGNKVLPGKRTGTTHSQLTITLQIVAGYDEDRLTDEGKEMKKDVSEKGIRAIRRLSSIQMPDFQTALLSPFGTEA